MCLSNPSDRRRVMLESDVSLGAAAVVVKMTLCGLPFDQGIQSTVLHVYTLALCPDAIVGMAWSAVGLRFPAKTIFSLHLVVTFASHPPPSHV